MTIYENIKQLGSVGQLHSNTLVNAECLEAMKYIADKSIDMVLCDLPYGQFGTTACKWDTIIPFDKLWEQYNRILKEDGNIILFSAQPFTSFLLVSNVKNFRYDLVWKKNTGVGFNTAKWQPLRYHESILVFSKIKKSKYNPIPTERFSEQSKKACKKPIQGGGRSNTIGINMGKVTVQYDSETKNPESVLEFKSVPNGGGKKLHPTQKPVPLLEYLIKTYTNEGETVLDNTCGSGSTGVACVNTKRNFIGIEMDEAYFEIASKRINEAQPDLKLKL